jgi:hypothetical protein
LPKRRGERKFGLCLGWDYLKKCRYSAQKPRPRHIKADPEAQQEFKKLHEKVRELQGKFPDAVIEIWSFDEQTLVPRYRFAIV